MNYDQAYDIFRNIDRLPGISGFRIGRWNAWAAVKSQLLQPLLKPAPAALGENSTASNKGWTRRVGDGLQIPRAILGDRRNRNRTIRSDAPIVFLTSPRNQAYPDGIRRNPVFDDLLTGTGLARDVLVLQYPGAATAPGVAGDNVLYLDATMLHCAYKTKFLLWSRKTANLGNELAAFLDGQSLPYGREELSRRLRVYAAVFEGRRRTFRRLFERLKPSALVLSYGPGHAGEIAAARELSIPVIEFQHGMIGARCPEYQWPEAMRNERPHLPIPDQLCVYGPVFESLLRSSGFWRPDEISTVGSGPVDRWRHLLASVPKPSEQPPHGKLRVLFMTQPGQSWPATTFWPEVLRCANERGLSLELIVKPHPSDPHGSASLGEMAGRHPNIVRVLTTDVHPLEAITAADVVVACHSQALIEAVAFGVPAISLLSPAIPGGIAGTFAMPEIIEAMPHVSTVEEMLQSLGEIRRRQVEGNERTHAAKPWSERLFSTGFLENAVLAINQVIAGASGKATD